MSTMQNYHRAWIFAGWMMLVFITMPIWDRWLRQLGEGFGLAGGVFWLMHGVAALTLFRCAECGTTLFRGKLSIEPLYTPWPHRRCQKCGHDAAEAEVS
jgi:hypothetical protein